MKPLVVLVPGFCGSNLYRWEGMDRRPSKLWLDQLSLAAGGIEYLSTSADRAPLTPGAVMATSVLDSVYQPILKFFADAGVDHVQWPYDWRNDIATNGEAFRNFLQEFRRTPYRVCVLAHSMGGLIAARGIQNLDDETAAKVPLLITAGTPWQGSFRAVELLSGRHGTFELVVGLNTLLTFGGAGEWRERTRRVVAGWPGVYDLLPSVEMLNQYQTLPVQNPWQPAFWRRANQFIDPQQLASAPNRRPARAGFPPGVTHHNWRGLGRITAGPMPSVHSDGSLSFYFNSLNGDGVVPEWSAWSPVEFNSVPRNFDVEHEQFLNDAVVMRALREVIGF